MKCTYCGGQHSSELCIGNNILSMRESVDEVNQDIELISEQNDDHFNTFIDVQERTNEVIHDGLDDLSASINQGASDIANEVFNLNNSLQQSLKYNLEAQQAIADSISKSLGGINNSVLISGILNYIIQDEQLELEEERLKLEEEDSSAGKARRELLMANSLLIVNPEQALNHVNKSIELYPSSAQSFATKGTIESKLGQHELAIISLQCAQALFDQECYTPSIRHINEKFKQHEIDDLNKRICVALSIEHSLISNHLESLKILGTLINKYRKDVDIKIDYLRQLSQTNLWSEKYKGLIEEIVQLSPSSFECILNDKQLQIHTEEVNELLNDIKKRKTDQLINKYRVASILKKPVILSDMEDILKLPYDRVFQLVMELDSLLKG